MMGYNVKEAEFQIKHLQECCESYRAKILDMENTINAIADPDDYETGVEKTAETCRRIAAECVVRFNL